MRSGWGGSKKVKRVVSLAHRVDTFCEFVNDSPRRRTNGTQIVRFDHSGVVVPESMQLATARQDDRERELRDDVQC
jgi:hypothetical protein